MIERRRSPRRAAGCLLGLLGGLAAGLILQGPMGVAAHGQGDPLASPCAVDLRTSARPSLVRPGDFVRMQDDLVFSCPRRVRPVHLALVAWRPEDSDMAAWLPEAFAQLGEDLAPAPSRWVGVGAVAYGARAEPLCPVGWDGEALGACLARLREPLALGPGGEGLAAAVYEAWKGLALARRGSRLRSADEPPREEMLVVVPPAGPWGAAPCTAATAELGRARADGVGVSLVCADGDCAGSCLAPAIDPGRWYPRSGWSELAERSLVLARSSELVVRQVTLRENLGPDVVLLRRSPDPASGAYDPATGVLGWELILGPDQRLELSYSLMPSRTGHVALTGGGLAVFTDSQGRDGSAALPPRRATVGWTVLLPKALRVALSVAP